MACRKTNILYRCLFSLLCACLLTQSAFAEPLILDPNQGQYSFQELNALILEDDQGTMNIEQVRSSIDFAPISEVIFNGGYTNKATWIRLDLANESASMQKRIIEFLRPTIDEIDLYLFAGQQLITHKKAGDKLPFSAWEINHSKPSLRLELPPQRSDLVVYLRYQTLGSLVIAPGLWRPLDFWEHTTRVNLLMGIYVGLIGVMVLYNLFLYWSLKDLTYLYYVIFISLIGTYQLTQMGLDYQWLWPESIHWKSKTAIFFGLGGANMVMVFANSFLQLSKRHPRLYRVAMGLIILNLLFLPTLFFPVQQAFYKPAILLIFVSSFFALYCGIISLNGRFKPARFFLLASGSLLVSTIYYLFALSGWIAYTPITSYSMAIGSALEVVFLSFALGDRINVLRQEKEAADAMVIETQRQATATLEIKVAERTKELQVSNATKDRFFSIIAHDLRSPIGSLNIIFNRLTKKSSDIDEKLYKSIQATTTQTDRLLDNLLTWARSQRGEVEVKPQNCRLQLIIDSTLELLAETARLKGIEITQNCPPNTYVWADPSMLATVVRNLISNGIKFTHPGGSIHLSAMAQADEIRIEIHDTGIGIQPETLTKLFQVGEAVSSPGTNRESGTGLGLVLCKEFIEKNQGKIGVESEHGMGSRFWFTLPQGDKEKGEGEDWIDRLKSLDVLAVEDDPLYIQSIQKALEGYNRVTLATSGAQAVEQALETKANLILMDIELPGFNGIEAAQQIWEQAKVRPWIMALSSYSPKEVERQSGGMTFDGCLGKPLDKGELMVALYPLINKS